MLNKKIIFMAILLVSMLSLSAVSAAEDATSDIDAAIDDAVIDESISEEISNEELILEESDDGKEDNIGAIDKGWFVNLDDHINNGGDVVDLNYSYVYNPETDSGFEEGISINHNVTINGNGYTISGNNQSRIFKIPGDITVVLKNINFVDGYTDGYGGAIYKDYGGGCKAINCTFTGNTATNNGGAIYPNLNSENCTAINCTFTGNTATNFGAMDGTAINCTFTGNTATNNGGAMCGDAYNCNFTGNTAKKGGAMYGGTATSCTFTQNTAEHGGAVNSIDATNCNFTGNTATYAGGAYYCSGNDRNVTNCTFTENTADSGGAMYGGNATDCNFIGNTANYVGGAIANGNANNCNFTGNTATNYGGAIYGGNANSCNFNQNTVNGTHGRGGAISEGDATNCNFTGNSATNGGAISEGDATNCNFNQNSAENGGAFNTYPNEPNIATNCNFTGNTATNYGGAMEYGTANNCTFTQNNATYGGAIDGANATNCTFTQNNATYGGAIYGYEDDPITATNCTFTQNNAAEEGGAIYNVTANGCTFALNTAKGNSSDVNDGSKTDANCKFYTPVISADDFKTTYNYGAKFNFKIATPDQELKGLKTIISIYKNGTPYANFTALSGSGWTVSLPAGTYQVVLSLEGYNVDPVSKTITVAKNPAKITASAVTATYNVNKYLVIKLTDGKGKALSGVKVTVTLGTSKVYTTDKNGQIKINVAKKVPKTYTVTIKYAGTANYLAFTKKVKVVVKKATPKMTAKAKAFKVKVKVKKYTITLKNNKGVVMKKIKVTLTVNKKTFKATTNSKGVATFKITNLKKKGKYTATIKYAGSKYYKKLTKKVKITVKK